MRSKLFGSFALIATCPNYYYFDFLKFSKYSHDKRIIIHTITSLIVVSSTCSILWLSFNIVTWIIQTPSLVLIWLLIKRRIHTNLTQFRVIHALLVQSKHPLLFCHLCRPNLYTVVFCFDLNLLIKDKIFFVNSFFELFFNELTQIVMI